MSVICLDELQETKSTRDQYQQSNLRLLQQLQQTEQARQVIEQQYQQQLQESCTLQQQLEQLCSQQRQPHWVVGREEVTMTHEVLGDGSYGKVKVAMFRGLRVAAKSLHGIIISDYTRDLFSMKWILLLEYVILILSNLLELLEWVHPLSLQRS